MKKVFVSNCVDDTKKIAKNFAAQLNGGDVVVLGGELGAGKTAFSKGVAEGLSVSANVTSPTFAIHNVYQGRLRLDHFDFYRLDEAEAEALGLNEFFGDKNAVSLIEWWTNIRYLLPKKCIFVDIKKTGEEEREITIDYEYTCY